ncbi:MAG: hypothetical protein OEY14_05695, partial [Myxococcales bacterium]|nr:hypothetical protein [Myxococcales bacterium]
NGMRAWRSEAAVRMRHIGDTDRLRDQIGDAIPVAFAEARGDIEMWKRAVDVLMDSALEEIESLRGFGLSTADVQAIGRTLAEEHALLPESASGRTLSETLRVEVSAFDVANAITATAQTRTAPVRLGMEEVGHRYLTRSAG